MNNSSGSTTGDVNYYYDSDGRIEYVTGGNDGGDEDSSYTYDDDGRMTYADVTVGIEGDGYFYYDLAQTFDADGNRLTLAATVQGTADLKDTFGYNNLDELTSETQQGQTGGNAVAPEGVTFGYDADGNETSIGHYSDTSATTSVFTTTNTFDHDQRLTGVADNSSSASLTQSYGYNADDWLTSESNSTDGSRTYIYDNDGRETAVNKGSGSSFVNEDYTYDTAGNRLSATTGSTHVASIGVGTGNRINNDASGSVGYDADGNRVNRSGGSTTVSYTFNAADQMTGASQTTSGSTNFTASYWYDPLTGQRMAQSVTAGTTTAIQFYIYDPQTGNPLLTLNGSGQVTERDLPGPGPGQASAVDTGMTGSGAGTTGWLITDNVGSVTDVMNDSGTVIDHVTMDSFGNITAQSNASAGVRFGFAGMILDPTTGLMYDEHRYYTCPDGTFVTSDPTGFGGGDYNLYRYAGGDPGTYDDPTGLVAGGDPVVVNEQNIKDDQGNNHQIITYDDGGAVENVRAANGTLLSLGTFTGSLRKVAPPPVRTRDVLDQCFNSSNDPYGVGRFDQKVAEIERQVEHGLDPAYAKALIDIERMNEHDLLQASQGITDPAVTQLMVARGLDPSLDPPPPPGRNILDAAAGQVGDLLLQLQLALGTLLSPLTGDFADDLSAYRNFVGFDPQNPPSVVYVNGIETEYGDANDALTQTLQNLGLPQSAGAAVPNGTHGPFGLQDFVQILIEEADLEDTAAQRAADLLHRIITARNALGLCGHVHVFAHSQGTHIILLALRLLTPAERAMIDLHCYGGESQLGSTLGLAAVSNDAHPNDPVPFVGQLNVGKSFFEGFPVSLNPFVLMNGFAGHNYIGNYVKDVNPGVLK